MIALLCSGQGAQGPDMFDRLEAIEAAEPVFAAAASLLGTDPRVLVREAAPATLQRNRTAQILCCTAALAAWSALAGRMPRRRLVAGYSVGELAAWGVAGLADTPTILHLAALRAEAMDAAARDSGLGEAEGGMMSVLGLSRGAVETLCDGRQAAVAIVAGARSIVVGGSTAGLDAVAEAARDAGAERTLRLGVHIPSHTKWLQGAVPRFAAALEAAIPDIAPDPGLRLLAGIDAAPVRDAGGRDRLARQLAQTIDWAGCVDAMRAAGIRRALELGPGRALSRLTDDIPTRSLADFRSIDGACDWLLG